MDDKIKVISTIGFLGLAGGVVGFCISIINRAINSELGIPSRRELKKLEELRRISDNLTYTEKTIKEDESKE